MEKEGTFEELQRKAIEASDKRFEDYFVKTHEMLIRHRKKRLNFEIKGLSERLASIETNPLLEEISPLNRFISKSMSDVVIKESEIVEHILRNWIDDPIIGEITKDSLKQRCIRTVLFKEPCEMDYKIERSGNDIKLEITSRLIGVVQGDYLIGIDGQRSLLTEEQNRRLFEMGV